MNTSVKQPLFMQKVDQYEDGKHGHPRFVQSGYAENTLSPDTFTGRH